MQRLLHIVLFIAVPYLLPAQVITGSWYGHADVEMAGMHNNYLTELVIKQKGTKVEGIFGYYFRDKYQSFFIHGRYNPQTREVTILNIPIIYFASNNTVNGIDCPTNFRGVLMNSKMGSSVKGTFYHDNKYKYLCPDIKVRYELDKSDNQHDSLDVLAASIANARIWKPQEDDYVVDAKAPPVVSEQTPAAVVHKTDSAVAKKPDSAIAVALPPATAAAPAKDTAAAAPAVATTPPPPPVDPVVADNRKITETFNSRKSILNKEFNVESDSVRLSFYDNGDIDGDSISVFVNNQPVLTHQELASKAFNLYLHLDSTKEVNEISMFAENLGTIPPNTALMVLTDGKNRYEVFLSSSLSENATIRVKRKKPL